MTEQILQSYYVKTFLNPSSKPILAQYWICIGASLKSILGYWLFEIKQSVLKVCRRSVKQSVKKYTMLKI